MRDIQRCWGAAGRRWASSPSGRPSAARGPAGLCDGARRRAGLAFRHRRAQCGRDAPARRVPRRLRRRRTADRAHHPQRSIRPGRRGAQDPRLLSRQRSRRSAQARRRRPPPRGEPRRLTRRVARPGLCRGVCRPVAGVDGRPRWAYGPEGRIRQAPAESAGRPKGVPEWQRRSPLTRCPCRAGTAHWQPRTVRAFGRASPAPSRSRSGSRSSTVSTAGGSTPRRSSAPPSSAAARASTIPRASRRPSRWCSAHGSHPVTLWVAWPQPPSPPRRGLLTHGLASSSSSSSSSSVSSLACSSRTWPKPSLASIVATTSSRLRPSATFWRGH